MMHSGRVVLVTGAARGIGRAIAVTFARQGADLIICDIDEPVEGAQSPTAQAADLEDTARLIRADGRRCVARVVDVRVQATLDAAVLAGLDAFGHIDVAVANAGVMHAQPFAEIDDETWTTILDINLSGVWRTAKAVTPHMVQRRSGVFLATGSLRSRMARRDLCAYTAAKHGLLGLMKTMALELGEYNIRVNTVLPGVIHTPIIDNLELGMLDDVAQARRLRQLRQMSLLNQGDPLPPEAIAHAMSWLASDEACYVTGVELPVDAGGFVLPGINEFID